MTRYIWMFNTSAYAKPKAREIAENYGAKEVVFADPRPEKHISAYDLRRQSIVGVYEVRK